MTEIQIKHMVNRFLFWKLPPDFHPDAGISFEPEFNKEWNAKQGKPPQRHEPVGTNLFSADQATAMVRHLVEDMPDILLPEEACTDARMRELWKEGGGSVDRKGRAFIETHLLPELLRGIIKAANRAGAGLPKS